MKSILVSIVAAVVLVGCGESSGELLLQSVREGNVKAVKQHLAAGADVNAKDDDGKTPLNWAIRYNLTKTADLLRKHGGQTGEELKAEDK
jgi:ankyrin repeat protein